MYTCKECGCEYDLRPRFCPKCGSYFINANDETCDYEWKGVIRADGTVSNTADIKRIKNSSADIKYAVQMTTRERVWGILGIVFSAHALMFSVFSAMAGIEFLILVVPNFILAIMGALRTYGAMRRVTYILLLISVILVVLSLLIGER